MTRSIQPVVPLTFPLTGSYLIEASAGTGKTFTIAMLYVRLVLGHGDENAFGGKNDPRSLTPPEILVVTFTDAAAKELRDRIRARLTEAATYFRIDPADVLAPEQPDLLHDLREGYEPKDWPTCARKLELAAEWMDEAAVSTIHSWCNRMLREHAFDSQSLFTQKLEKDQSELLSEVVRDYWRSFYYPLAADAVSKVTTYWERPDELKSAVKRLLEHTDRLPEPKETPEAILCNCARERQQRLTKLKEPWVNWADELQGLFDRERDNGNINGKILKQNNYTGWFDKLLRWATSSDESVDIGAGWERLTPNGMAEAWRTTPPSHVAFDKLQQIKPAIEDLPEPKADLLAHAAHWIAKEFEAAQKRRAQMGFNELLTGLETALHGDNGDRLADVIRQQFPVALIDEFQDTDPVQYRIFDKVYAIADNRQDSALILIGDPKQAIYAFRGADIYTYLKARTAVNGRLYTLDTNFRSTQAMVDASNHCFNHIEQEEASAGAFLFRCANDNPVPFQTVNANGLEDNFKVHDNVLPAMTLAVLSQEAIVSKENYRERMSEICATQIVEWLHLGNQQCAGFLHEKNGFRAVQPSDMAILVNRRIEATSIRKALSRRGVRSVYLSDRDSIYATRQAHEVQRWLSACAEPDNDKLLRAALSTPSLGLPFRELDELNSNEEAWEARVVQFKGYREIWQKQGVLPTIRRILFDFGCTDRLLTLASDPAGQSGERILTDLLHLAEVLQQASVMLEGEHALIRHLSEQMAEAEDENKEAADEKKMRLESDADLVKVVTIHKSKGLEYPIVFLPFICDTRLTKNSDVPLKWHDDGGELQVSLVSDAEILESAERDRLGEDLRKVYVALTRARYMTWLGIARVNESEPCAISHLFGLKDVEVPRYLETIQTFAKDQSSIFVTNDLKSDLSKFCGADRQNAPGAAFRAKRAVKENWWISSYSALHFEGHSAPELPALDDTPQAENLIEAQREILSVAPTDRGGSQSMHGFPKGASAGVFLHELMESAANLGFAEVMADPEKLPEKFKDMITRGCELRRWEDWIDTICTWVKQMLSTELKIGEKPVQLSSLKTVKAEMEFWFETTQVDLLDLDGTVKANTLEERDRPSLTPGTLNGMLKGFMDLVFEHEGRYYVADYKSNWLGPTDEAYTREAMDEAIRAHRYDLQYVIYLLALHRLLKSRLRGYDYDRHVGGAVYLFVRGINATSRGVHFEKPPKQLIERLDACFAGAAGGVQ